MSPSLRHQPIMIPIVIGIFMIISMPSLTAQSFPAPGVLTIPQNKMIWISYEVTVNANACPVGTVNPANIFNQSNVSGSNFGTVITDDPALGGPIDPTLTPFGALTLGDLVYKDNNKNGVFDAGDVGIDFVVMNLYLDDGDGMLDAGDGAALMTTNTAGGGLYSFTPICPGNYIVQVAASNFNFPFGVLYDGGLMTALVSSPLGGAPDPDNDINNDDNGDPVAGFGVASAPITLAYNTEPITDGDANVNTNLTLDFGFKIPTTVTINDVTMVEGTGGSTTSFIFTVTRSNPDEAFTLTVNTMDGTASSPSDFTAITGGMVSFTAAGPLTQTVTVLVNHDNVVEANETFTVVLSGAPAGIVVTDASGLGTITNDDAAIVTLATVGLSALAEGNAGTTSFMHTVTLNNPVQGGFTIAYNTNDGTATVADLDYADNDGTLIFAGTAGESQPINVLVNGDLKVELDETFTVTLGTITGPSGVTSAGSPQTRTITNDDAAVVSLAGNVTHPENVNPFGFTVNLSNPVDVAVTVLFNTSDGSAIAPGDYTTVTNQLVTFPAGTTTAQLVGVPVINDLVVENTEVFNVAISALMASGRNVTLGTAAATGTILDNDVATVTLSGGGAAAEGNVGNTPRVFTATLSAAVQGGFMVAYTTNDGTATTLDLDYVDNDGILTFAGTSGEMQTITVQVIGDFKVEPDETFTVNLGAITGSPPGVTTTGSPQTGTITNDEVDYGDAPDPTFPTLLANNGARHNTVFGNSLGATIDGESNGQPNATATGDGSDEDGVTLPAVFITGTTATITVNASVVGVLNAWMDFNNNGSWADAGEQIFTNTALVAGNNSLMFAVPVAATPALTFARFRFATGAGLGFTGLAIDGEVEDYQVNILNNQFSITSPTVTEGNAGTTPMVYTISRTVNTTNSSVDYAITGGTATSGTDYIPIASGTVNFVMGGALTQDITVNVNGDFIIESNETVIITLSNPVNGGIGTNPGTGTITNDDLGTLTLTGGIAQNETNAGIVSYTFTATLTGDVQGGFIVAYTTNDGTATTADNDYADNDGMLTFAGTTGETETIVVMVNGDLKVELNETFTVALGAISGTSATQAAAITTVGSPQTGTITNDDAAVINIAGNVVQSENAGPQIFTITLSNPVDVAVTVNFNTSDGTAMVADADYGGIVMGVVTFPAGSTTSQTVSIPIPNDNKVEGNEVYNVAISNLMASGRNVTLGTTSGTGTINNDDSATVTLSGSISQNEGNSGTTPFVFTATLNNPVQGGFTVAYNTNDGTATTADNDYQDNDGTLTFAGTAGEPETITVLVNGDLNIEPNETFTVTLGTVTALTPVQTAAIDTAGSPQTGTILNDELDYGDAPTAAQSGFVGTYPTLLANNGARHAEAPGGLRLGATVDADLDGQPDATATGDGADEDGVTLPGAIVINTSANITVNVSAAGFLNAWVDFNRDGDWADAGEQIYTNQAVIAGDNNLSFAVPAAASLGTSFARFRLATLGGLLVTGLAADGEVEDYQVNIVNTQFSIDDPSVLEGNAGTANLVFTITRSNNASNSSIDYAITGGTATVADGDYQAFIPGTASFTAGGALTQTVTVVVIGDVKVELDETVIMTLSNPVNASILDGSGTGTIINDDAAVITITSPSIAEGDVGTVNLVFDITMSNPSDADVVYNYSTADGTAMVSNLDYTPTAGVQTIAAGATTQTISVPIIGDCVIEPDEIFSLILSSLNANGRAITFFGGGPTLTGTGTILNEDFPPVITCPPNTTISCEASQLPANTGLATATDDCAPAPVVTFTDATAPGNCANNYTITRTWKATDGTQDMSTCNQVITVRDITPPTLTCPAAVTVQCAAFVPGQNTGLVTATDNCGGGAPTVTFIADATVNQTCFNRFNVIRTYRATDVCGNSATCTQTITVFDNTPPTLTCPAAVTVQCANLVPAVNLNLVTADNCTGPVPTISFVSDVTTNQTCFNRLTITRTYRSTDACGNSATCAQVITVFDNTPPTITCPVNVTVQCANLIPAVNLSLPVSDNCSGPVPVVTHVSDVTTNFVCFNRFNVTRTYRVTDACGNSSTCTQLIVVFDNTAPVIAFNHPLLTGVPNNGTIEIQCFGQDPEWVPPVFNQTSVTVTDNCTGPAPIVSFSETLVDGGDCIGDGYINRYRMTWTATDACGNSSSRTAFINLVDEIPPVILGVPDNITVNCDEIPEPPDNVMAIDECLCACVIEYNQTNPLPGCQDGQVIVRSWLARDDCGNETVETQNITLIDETGPVLQITYPDLAGLPDGTIINHTCSEGGIPGFYNQLNAGSVSSPASCGGVPVITFKSNNFETNNCDFFGYIQQRLFEWTGVDQCGNVTTLTIRVRLIDDEAPVLLGVPEMTCMSDPALLEIEAADNCDEGVFTFYDVQIPNPCGNGNAIRRTYQAFDPCGNTSEESVILLPDDANPPTMIFTNPDLAGLNPGEVLMVDCDASNGQHTSFGLGDISVDDDCPEGLNVTYEERVIEILDCSGNGILAAIQSIWTATDMCGNSSQLTALINVIDQTPPTFVNFKNVVSIGCNDPMPGFQATDNCGDVVITTVETIIPGGCEFEYDVDRVVTATDACGNETTLLQTVHVGSSGPVISGVVVEVCDDLSIPDVTAWDPCAGQFVEVTMVEANIMVPPCRHAQVIERTWSATDACGNVSEITQQIIMGDVTPPEILIATWSIIRRFMDEPYNLVLLSETGIMERLDDLEEGSITVIDDCDQEIIPVFTLVSTLAGDCVAEGYFERRVYSWIATDICGNSSSVTFSVDIMDDIPPVMDGIPADEIIICEELPVAPTVTSNDPAQPVTIVYSENVINGIAPGEFAVTRNWVATDACGNSSSATQSITWIPDTQLSCEITMPGLVDCNSHGVVLGSTFAGGVGALTYEWEIEGEKCFIQSGQGTDEIAIYIGFSEVNITLTITDAFGCSSVCQATLTCLDPFDDTYSIIPVIVRPDEQSITPTHAHLIITDVKDNLQHLNLWPNPANESLHLSFKSYVEDEVEISLTNLLGQVVLIDEMDAAKGYNARKIDVSQMAEGSYLLQIRTEKEVHTKVIVVMR